MLLCVASNGLEVAAHAAELGKLQVSHVTLTVNAIDPEIGARIYAWVRAGIRVLRGVEGAAVLLERQRAAIAELKRHGITVKINTIVMPGVNDEHAAEVAREVAALGADIMNCIPMYPVAGTPFESLGNWITGSWPSCAGARRSSCRRCCTARAAAPMPWDCWARRNPPSLIELLRTTAAGPANPNESRPYVALASHEGVLINQHVGEASRFWVFEPQPGGPPALVETRDAPEAGGGADPLVRPGGVAARLQGRLHQRRGPDAAADSGAARNPRDRGGRRGIGRDCRLERHRPGPARDAEAVPGLRPRLRGSGNGLRIGAGTLPDKVRRNGAANEREST